VDDVLSAIDAIQSDYAKQCRGARAIAQKYFRAETVLGKLVSRWACDLGVHRVRAIEKRL
jgi:hypothetical protein